MQQVKNSFEIRLLSVVVPAYKQQKTIFADIENIHTTIASLGYSYEIIVVVDGNVDNTFQNAKKYKSKNVNVLGYEKNYGKGHAVRYGMMHAKGDIIGFIDAGMDIDPSGFRMLLNHMEWYNADVIVGSKLHPVSKVEYPLFRKVLSRGYRLLTRLLFGFQVRDTQVGLKFFKDEVVKDILPRVLVKKYAFDIEMLAVAYRCGYTRIYEAPVDINFKSNTITNRAVWKTVLSMLWDTMAVFYRLRILHYYDKKRVTEENIKKAFK